MKEEKGFLNMSTKNEAHIPSGRLLHAVIGLIAAVLLILFDQWSKYLVVHHLKGQSPVPLISGVFELQYLENRGAAFGIFQGRRVFFLVITVVFLLIAVWFYSKLPLNRRFLPLRIITVVLAAGAVGNMIDRAANNYVVDFFYFKLINFPIFNVADIYVTVGAIGLILLLLFCYKEEDLNQIFPSKNKDGD